jgi:energy-converting hydrogenase B subunit P
MSLGGYIVEYDFPYRDLIIVNETAEEIKFEIPVFDGSYIEEYEKLGLKVIPVSEHDSYLNLYKKGDDDVASLTPLSEVIVIPVSVTSETEPLSADLFHAEKSTRLSNVT